jgi:hypothetical protein
MGNASPTRVKMGLAVELLVWVASQNAAQREALVSRVWFSAIFSMLGRCSHLLRGYAGPRL